MKSLYFLTFSTIILIALGTYTQAVAAVSDTAPPLSDSGARTATVHADKNDLIAKRRAALANSAADTCKSRKAKAMERRKQLVLEGAEKSSPKWRTTNRQITILNDQCQASQTSTQLIASICERQETALLRKLDALQNAGLPTRSEEFISTELQLINIRKRCTAHSMQ